MKTKPFKPAFTLIELLVVIAIIGLLLAIVVPSMKKATEYARKVMCKSNLRQITVAMSTYENECQYNFRNTKTAMGLTNAQMAKTWFWESGTADLAHEDQPRAIRFLMGANLLPDRKVFFCPGVINLSYDTNYALSEVTAGLTRARNTDEIHRLIATGGLPAGDRPLFWSTYVWIWKKEKRPGDTQVLSVNNGSIGAMMLDMTNGLWAYAQATDPSRLGMLMRNTNIRRAYSHGNVLMQDYSVVNPSDQDPKLNEWLWGSPYWAGNPAFNY